MLRSAFAVLMMIVGPAVTACTTVHEGYVLQDPEPSVLVGKHKAGGVAKTAAGEQTEERIEYYGPQSLVRGMMAMDSNNAGVAQVIAGNPGVQPGSGFVQQYTQGYQQPAPGYAPSGTYYGDSTARSFLGVSSGQPNFVGPEKYFRRDDKQGVKSFTFVGNGSPRRKKK